MLGNCSKAAFSEMMLDKLHARREATHMTLRLRLYAPKFKACSVLIISSASNIASSFLLNVGVSFWLWSVVS